MRTSGFGKGVTSARAVILAVLALHLGGCVTGRTSSLSIEVCTAGQGGTKSLLGDLKDVAGRHNLTFIDNRTRTRDELQAIGAETVVRRAIDKPIMVALNEGSRTKVMVSTLGLLDNQVLISLFYKAAPSKDEATAHQIVTHIETRFKIEKVPDGQGAQGMKSCM